MEHKKVATSAEVYAVLFARHGNSLKPFSSFSDPDGTFMGRDGSEGRMDTEYGFEGADAPTIGIRTTWPITRNADGLSVDGEHGHQYWLCIVKEVA